MTLPTKQYLLPDVNLLDENLNKLNEDDIITEMNNNSNIIIETLNSFGVKAEILGVVRGLSVTRYEIRPAPGVKISKITSLKNDIALNLASEIRIEAPIPGKSAIGVDVPNKNNEIVLIRDLIDSDDFRENASDLGVAIGKTVFGENIILDITKMPHLLIAGSTGSGKTVCINSILMSILFRYNPEEVRIIIIDSKSMEYIIYNDIPHLLIPVITDPLKAAGALKWAVNEMTRRYEMFTVNNVRDIRGYNEAVNLNDKLDPMAKIVIIIDELADLMITATHESEENICRLLQKAHNAGIHIVIATQRPNANVVTGLIKANITSRIVLKVSSQAESRTIIDVAGANMLLGKGDMLYKSIDIQNPIRIQGCLVSFKEIGRVVNFIKCNSHLKYDKNDVKTIMQLSGDVSCNKEYEIDFSDIADDRLEEAIEAVIDSGKASTSYLQLRLKVGYGRAAQMIDTMENMGIINGFDGNHSREVLITKQEWDKMKNNLLSNVDI